MEFIYLHTKGCNSCYYIELLLRHYNVFNRFKVISKEGLKGIEYIDKYNLNSVPVILVFNNNELVDIYKDLDKSKVIKMLNKYNLM